MSSGFMLLLGIVALVVGLLMFAGWFDWILRVGGIILIIVGILAIIVAIFGMMGNRNRVDRF